MHISDHDRYICLIISSFSSWRKKALGGSVVKNTFIFYFGTGSICALIQTWFTKHCGAYMWPGYKVWRVLMLAAWHWHHLCTFCTLHTGKGFEHSEKGFDAKTARASFIKEVLSVLFRAAQTWRKSIKTNISEAAYRLPPSLICLLANALLCCIINLHGEAESWEFLRLQSCSF